MAYRDGFYACGESGQMKKDFPKARANISEVKKVSFSDEDVEPHNKNTFYSLQSKDDQE